MNTNRKSIILGLICILGCVFGSVIKANYYQPDFFPIGLTGINITEQDGSNNCPYGGLPQNPWSWDAGARQEKALIDTLGVNCIGSQDAKPSYLVDLDPDSSASNWSNNYLNKVCIPSFRTSDSIFIITSGYWIAGAKNYVPHSHYFKCAFHKDPADTTKTIDDVSCDSCSYDTAVDVPAWNVVAYYLFHSPYRNDLQGVGSMLFSPCGSYTCHGTHENNWNTFEGDSLWRHQVADSAVYNWGRRFSGAKSSDIDYIWGCNLISEDPAMYRNAGDVKPWAGSWAAVNRIFRGGNLAYRNKFSIPPKADVAHITVDVATHKGIRGIEEDSSAYSAGHRMIFAKGCVWPLEKANLNIFEYLPDIDVILQFTHGWLKAYFNYGEQGIFDSLLYGHAQGYAIQDKPNSKNGEHYTALYMQKYGKTCLAYPDQRRRWIAVMALEWQIDPSNITRAKARRPCPPEIRCATYLQLSRGAKGVLFQPWTYNYKELTEDSIFLDPSEIQIPVSDPKITRSDCYNLGLRDQAGYPFGMSGSLYDTTHRLNSGTWSGGNTYWHQHSKDTTYYYLAHSLIPELKKIKDVLIQLDWVNGYSLNSTDPEWASPCPHYYLKDVWGVEYADVGFFDHPYEPVGVEYFMLVNREGIADMTNRTVTVALDAGHWPGADSLILTDIANKEHPKTLIRNGDRFVFTQVFEPGEGKLYRVAPVNEPPITMLHH